MAQVIPIIMAVVSAAGAISESNTQQAQLKMAAQADEMNAEALKQQAGTVNEQANAQEEQQRKQARQILAEQRAAIAEAGTGITSSTNQKLAVQSAQNAEQDALNIRYGGLLEAHGLMAQSAQEMYQAKAARSQVGRVRASGYLNAFASGLSAYSGSGGKFGSYGGTTTGGYTGTGLSKG